MQILTELAIVFIFEFIVSLLCLSMVCLETKSACYTLVYLNIFSRNMYVLYYLWTIIVFINIWISFYLYIFILVCFSIFAKRFCHFSKIFLLYFKITLFYFILILVMNNFSTYLYQLVAKAIYIIFFRFFLFIHFYYYYYFNHQYVIGS